MSISGADKGKFWLRGRGIQYQRVKYIFSMQPGNHSTLLIGISARSALLYREHLTVEIVNNAAWPEVVYDSAASPWPPSPILRCRYIRRVWLDDVAHITRCFVLVSTNLKIKTKIFLQRNRESNSSSLVKKSDLKFSCYCVLSCQW
jgi:hypothetical protein